MKRRGPKRRLIIKKRKKERKTEAGGQGACDAKRNRKRRIMNANDGKKEEPYASDPMLLSTCFSFLFFLLPNSSRINTVPYIYLKIKNVPCISAVLSPLYIHNNIYSSSSFTGGGVECACSSSTPHHHHLAWGLTFSCIVCYSVD